MKLSNIFRGLVAVVLVMSFLFLASPSPVAAAATITLDPISDNSTQLSLIGDTSNWHACTSSDGDTSYVWTNADTYQTDLYNLSDVSLIGTINSVTVYIRARGDHNNPNEEGARTAIRTGIVTFFGSATQLTGNYSDYFTTYATNPGGGAWTWHR